MEKNLWESYVIYDGSEIITNLRNGQPYIGIKTGNGMIPKQIERIEIVYDNGSQNDAYLLNFKNNRLFKIVKDIRINGRYGDRLYHNISKKDFQHEINKDKEKLNKSFNKLKKEKKDLAIYISKCMSEIEL